MLLFPEAHLPPWAQNPCLHSHVPYYSLLLPQNVTLHSFNEYVMSWHNIRSIYTVYTLLDNRARLFVLKEEVTQLKGHMVNKLKTNSNSAKHYLVNENGSRMDLSELMGKEGIYLRKPHSEWPSIIYCVALGCKLSPVCLWRASIPCSLAPFCIACSAALSRSCVFGPFIPSSEKSM